MPVGECWQRWHDDHRALEVGGFPFDYSAAGEYHAVSPRGERGGWYEPVWRPDWSHGRWAVVVDSGDRELAHTHPPGSASLLVREAEEWGEIRIEVPVRLMGARTRLGVLAGYQDSRRHLRLTLSASGLALERHHDTRVSLIAREPVHAQPDATVRLWLEVRQGTLRAGLDERVLLETDDTETIVGRVGLWADGPARFGALDVAGERIPHGPESAAVAHPAPRLWRHIRTPGYGTGRHLRFGDLDGDGRLEMVLPQHVRLGASHDQAMISALTAIDLDGRVLWTWGEPREDRSGSRLCADLPCQVHDLDGDGRAEVVFASGHLLRVLDGRTGRELRSMPMPVAPAIAEPRRLAARLRVRFDEVVLARLFARLGVPHRADPPWFPWPEDSTWRIRGDAIAFCDVSGRGRPTDIVIKDRYSHVWLYDHEFRPLWSSEHNTGHFPAFCDVDRDGRDEVLSGYRLLGPDGVTRWARDELRDHADAVAILSEPGTPGEALVAMVAGDDGFLLLDAGGRIRVQQQPGHAQRMGIGRFRADVAGPQFWVATYWGGAGIRALYDREGRVLHRSETPGRGQVLLPVHWTAGDLDLAFVSADPQHGGLIDGEGRRVVRMPDRGLPSECCSALDLTGDPRDELVCWDPGSIAIYSVEDDGAVAPGPRRVRSPLYNASNYRAEILGRVASVERGGH